MAKTHISSGTIVFLCMFVLGQHLATSEKCSLELGCSTSDFDCWYDCKHKYNGLGGCTNKDNIVISRPALLPQQAGFCCHCQCKFDSKPNEPCPKSAAPAQAPTAELH